MLGLDDGVDALGVIPRAVSWLYQLIDAQRQRTTSARFSVRVSAVELTGRHETLRDLLAPAAADSQPGPRARAPAAALTYLLPNPEILTPFSYWLIPGRSGIS